MYNDRISTALVDCTPATTTVENLKDRKKRAEQEVARLDEAIAILEANPDMVKVIDALRF